MKMQKMDAAFANLDLRLLRFLRHLLNTGSVSKTALQMGISQPAASRVLARIRDLTGDPILVRTQSGYRLTDHALSLSGPLDEAIIKVGAVFSPSAFEPLTSTLCFRIASTDYGVASVLGPVMERLTEVGPALRVDVTPLVPRSFDDLENGSIDLMLYVATRLSGDFLVQKLFDETYVVLFRQGHPLVLAAKGKSHLTQLDIAPYRQIEVNYPGLTAQRVDRVMREGGDNPNAVLHQPYFTAFPCLIGASDAVAAVPKRLGEQIAKLGPFETAPFRAEAGFPYHLLRHERTRHNKAINWFVRQAVAVCREPASQTS